MTRKKDDTDRHIREELLDALMEEAKPKDVHDFESLVRTLKKQLSERMLNAELDVHLDMEERQAGNHRNGHSKKTVLTDDGAMTLAIPRDRLGSFEPHLIEKYQRRFPGFDDKIISMYSRGMTTREIQGHIEEIYGLEVSPALISAVTDAVHQEVEAWRNRTLNSVYAIVYLDALRVKIRDNGLVQNKAVYLAIGYTCDGQKEILGLWIAENEGAKFWLGVLTELKNRGVEDILIAVVDGLKGFPEAIATVYPATIVQTCIVHLLRYSLHFASWKERKELARALKTIYDAASEEAAAAALEAFAASPLGQRYPMIAKSWKAHWNEVIPFFAFPKPIRRLIYTTNAIESLHSTVRRTIRNRGHFPNDQAAMKLIYLALQRAEAKWKRPPIVWQEAKAHFAVRFGDRFVIN